MLLFDATMYWQALLHGFPPSFGGASDDGLPLDPTTRQKVEWYAFVLVAGLAQAFVFVLTWKAWRNPKV